MMGVMDTGCGCPYFDPDFDLSECFPPIRMCIDNETCEDCTLVKVDCANRHGILLEMVQALTDLDLIIFKSYISSDGGWLMDVFHVTDRHGHKLTDLNLLRSIQDSLNFARKQPLGGAARDKANLNSICSVLEIASVDHPGLLSEVTAVLFELSCDMNFGEVWTYNGRAAFILNITEQSTGQPISDPIRLTDVEEQVRSVVDARHFPAGKLLWQVRLLGPTTHDQIHRERRLHQLMRENGDHEVGQLPMSFVENDHSSLVAVATKAGKRWFHYFDNSRGGGELCKPYVSVESWKERDYLVLNIRSLDRPKLLFDTVCALTDLNYDVFHASTSSHGSIAVQEYYVRRMDGCSMDNESEKETVVQSMVAALERRVPHGPKIELRTLYRHDLLSDVIRAFRESDLSIAKAKFGKQGEWVVGTFYIINASSSIDPKDIDQQRMEAIHSNIGRVRGIIFDKKSNSSNYEEEYYSCRVALERPKKHLSNLRDVHSIFNSLGSTLWSYVERMISNNFGSTRS